MPTTKPLQVMTLEHPFKIGVFNHSTRYLIACDDPEDLNGKVILIRESSDNYQMVFDSDDLEVRIRFLAEDDAKAIDKTNAMLEQINGLIGGKKP